MRSLHPVGSRRAAAGLAVLVGLALACSSSRPVAEPASPSSTGATPAVEAAAARVDALADLYYLRVLERTPHAPWLLGEVARHDRLADRSPAAWARAEAEDRRMLAELDAVDVDGLRGRPQWVTAGILREALEAGLGVRVCREELWAVDQMGGWHLDLQQLAGVQPVGTPELRGQALARWGSLPAFVDTEIANLEAGLAAGWSAPRSVVRLVVGQLEGMLAVPAAESPFLSPAERDGDPAFARRWRRLVEEEVVPALGRYRDLLAGSYLARAREELAVAALPDGRACYAASLRRYTTSKRTPEEIHRLGAETVEASRARVAELGEELYGVRDFARVVERVAADPALRFVDRDELVAFSRAAVERGRGVLDGRFGLRPERPVVVEPYPAYLEGSGVSSRYEPGSGDLPGVYRINAADPTEQRRDSVEIVAFHEAYPGHHLQVAVAAELAGAHRLTRVAFNSGYVEGWARYAEALAEEAGLYVTPQAAISRRAWPARGMVADPGLHVLGWSRERVEAFLGEAGRMPPSTLAVAADRIAVLPGQLTAYDTGGLEIAALRREAEAALGERFDLAAFHDRVLENGVVPLWLLREHVERWIETERRRP